MNTMQIPARDVQEGQRLTAVPGERLRRRRGVWPTVTHQSFREDGEGGEPTVYIETHEMPGYLWCLHPGEPVAVVVSDDEPGTGWRSWFPWRRTASVLAFLIAGAALSLAMSHRAHHAATPAGTPNVPPMGWTVACSPAVITPICRTYPPGDQRWEPTAPLPPQLPLILPTGTEGTQR